ncbi:MAG: glycosyltransferase family 2 protein [Planctomycetota bacterium]
MNQPTLVIIPAYREASRVGMVVRQVRALALEIGRDLDVLVVDDGSPDATGMEARAAGATVLRHQFNLGYGVALHTGYHYARRNGYARVLQMDADGQHLASMLPRLLDALDRGADVALGSRYADDAPPPTSAVRRIGTRVLAWVATACTGVRISDPTSGFQGLSARALEEVAHDGYPEDFPDTDVLIELARNGLVLREVPVRMQARQGGVSMHRGARIAYYGYKMLLTLLLMPIRRKTPLRTCDTVARRSA